MCWTRSSRLRLSQRIWLVHCDPLPISWTEKCGEGQGSADARFDPIHSAARQRDIAAIRDLIASGVEVDSINSRAPNGHGGNTALWFAAQGPWAYGLEVARVLVEAGAVVNKQCEHGRTALHMAAAWGHLDVVKFRVEDGADVILRDDEGMTPPMVACRRYRSNRVTHDQPRAVHEYVDALGVD